MRNKQFINKFLLPVLIVLISMSGAAGEGQGDQERFKLLEQQKMLTRRIDALSREQEYLLFLKTLSSTDSKYLVLALSTRTGQLKYKNRVLREFRFGAGPGGKPLQQGAASLTKKNEFGGGRNALIFGKRFIVQRKGLVTRETSAPRFSLKKKDFKAIFSALEMGAQAYVVKDKP